MTITVANTSNTNSFEYWLNRTNELATHMRNSVVTSDAGGNTNVTSGNVVLTGRLTVNNLVIGNSTISVTANSTIYSGISNNTLFVGSIPASNVVSNSQIQNFVNTSQLSTNLANYQTTAGLSANVATLTANLALFANSSLYANASVSNTFTVGSATYFVANGNVGIGTSSPAQKLEVNGNIKAPAVTNCFIGFADSVSHCMKFDAALDGIKLNGWGGIVFETAGANERMRINNAGNVGIGTNAPTYKLHVQGTGFSTSDFRAPTFYNSDDLNCFWTSNQLTLRGTSPTITFRDTDQNSAMIQCNDGVLYFLRGGIDTSTASAINSTWPLTLNLQNNNAVFGNTVTANGGLYTLSGVYAPVFYDYNNPAYYMNLEGNSVVNSVTANTIYLNRLYDTNNNLYPKLLSTITVSNSASISSSDVFSVAGSGYSDFMITFYRLFPSVNGQPIFLRWYGSGAYQSTNYVTYTGAFNGVGSASYGPTTYFNVTHTASNTSSRGYTGNIHIYNASATTTYKQWIHDASGYDSAGVITRVLGGGDLNLAAAITGFQLYAASGNISGTVKIYGLS